MSQLSVSVKDKSKNSIEDYIDWHKESIYSDFRIDLGWKVAMRVFKYQLASDVNMSILMFRMLIILFSFQVHRSLDKRNILILRWLMLNCNSANLWINSFIVASIVFCLIKKPELVIVTLVESMVNKSIIQIREVSVVFKWIHFI